MKSLNTTYCLLVLMVLGTFLTSPLFGRDYSVLDYGALADGTSNDTKAVQTAINKCSESGGGRVIIPSGKVVLIGTIYLKDYVTLFVENGATLKGSPDINDYTKDTHKNRYKNEPHMDRCLIYAENAKFFGIEGRGTIDGNGHPKFFNRKTGRPMLIRFLNCSNIQMRSIQLINPAAWTSAWINCNEIVVEGIRIKSRVNHNGDGLDFDGCNNVMVSNCSFDTSDDSICLQASDPNGSCTDIVINNCIFESKWAGIRIGLLSRGDFERVNVTNCTFKNIKDSGLKIQMNEGGAMKNMTFSNMTMTNVPRPIFMTFCKQRAHVDAPEELSPMHYMGDMTFENFQIDNRMVEKNAVIAMTGLPEGRIKNITLKNINMHIAGEEASESLSKAEVKELTPDVLEGWWPEFRRLGGTLPASGIYLRHMEGVFMESVKLFTTNDDKRSPIVFDDVENIDIHRCFVNGNKIEMTLTH
ncbi:glycoside hydrolase family 28 protein [Flammeovirga sp. EKP202]|uniref:glycoside hydrolase family 28 protein n=1 Tax=Flammeovirga sp. EKP202 TaxID=2770592 RepID=UPI00165F2588|nr:glycosyl hydrolase family 28 protein [Flammeovirga sp. EKP202]MBD0403869.1 right-handed parallel beta-helix repeat-containing protein [Flammeovirga sp. EKP202]